MKCCIAILFLVLVFSLTYNAYAIEFKPLVAKDADGVNISNGIVGKPIIFQHTVSNGELSAVDFEIVFSTFTPDDKTLDQQIQRIHLGPGETKIMPYQFVPINEGNYITSVFSEEYLAADSISFPALDGAKNYKKETIHLYSNSSDSDCSFACTKPSEKTVSVGTIVEWVNDSNDDHSISTGTYQEEDNGIGWSYDKRFSGSFGPNETFSFLFLEPGEYQYFLAEHRLSTTPVVGTIHVSSDIFPATDKTIDILQGIMNDKNSKIPITSLSVNPKNSIITVGIDDRKHAFFTIELYKKILYKQVGNVYLNIIPNPTPRIGQMCDVNDETQVRKELEKDPVVQKFLELYTSSTFEHFKTYDEPGNPRTYSEFRFGSFLLRVLVLSYDESGVCYPVYGYSVNHDNSLSEIKQNLFENFYSKSDKIQEAINAVKNLANPLKQLKSGIPIYEMQCNEGLQLTLKNSNDNPVCIKETSVKKLSMRNYVSDIIIIGLKHSLPEIEK
ncbi:cupredoxin domain-containing protein [Nitrosopumilus ureiphilus]|uniref:Uncharacterized protein n=1 Tax=Nitrosopumilus ureiphilus TaxID=1470067 RepID=A0A7D5R638_9ARCH|nr:hypothetical protein [Nitrosopumilus ureiphilus]QLH06657.1 hypothetical protein C5F50_05895 [Nitrosopumilus ureiphilus]